MSEKDNFKAKLENFSDDQIEQLKKVLDVISNRNLCLKEVFGRKYVLPYIVPYSHFPSMEIYIINDILNKLADIHIIQDIEFFKDEVSFNFSPGITKDKKELDGFKEKVEKRYNSILSREAKKSNKKISYRYDENIGVGKLFVGDFPEITFKKLRAKIINFFYLSMRAVNEYKNYHHFNIHADSDYRVTSDQFSKEIKAINKRIARDVKGIVKELIAKKKSSKKNEANLYIWLDKA